LTVLAGGRDCGGNHDSQMGKTVVTELDVRRKKKKIDNNTKGGEKKGWV